MTVGPTGTALALAAALLACASVEGPPPGPPPFRGAKKLVLVRLVEDPRAPRARDALDALKESLDARGYEARVVDIVPGKDPALRDLERLEDRVAGRFWNRDGRSAGVADRMGADAGAVVAGLGVDAVAGYHRLADRLPPLPPPSDPFAPRYPYATRSAPLRRPTGALSLVAADGSAAWFPWGGGQGLEPEPGALLNPAEAIDAVLAALAGTGGDDG